MTLVVDIRHWLDEYGQPHPEVRRRALAMARLIEYGGPLEPGEMRETLVECTARPGRKPCQGLLWVQKKHDGCIDAFCTSCHTLHAVISGWEDTDWASGPMEPVLEAHLPLLH